MKILKKLFKPKHTELTRYIHVPYFYPMGSNTFAVACSHCKNVGSKKCTDCKDEKKSGFELKQEV